MRRLLAALTGAITMLWLGTAVQAAPVEIVAGDLRVQAFWTDDAPAFRAGWAKPDKPKPHTIEKIGPGKPASLFLLLTHCKADAGGNCDVTGTISVTDPTGAAFAQPLDARVWQASAAQAATELVLSPATIELRFGSTNKAGAYRTHIQINDRIAGISAEADLTLTLQP